MHQPGVVIMACVNAVRLANNPEHRRVLVKAWAAKQARFLPQRPGSGFGKQYTSTMYGGAESVGLLSVSAETTGKL